LGLIDIGVIIGEGMISLIGSIVKSVIGKENCTILALFLGLVPSTTSCSSRFWFLATPSLDLELYTGRTSGAIS